MHVTRSASEALSSEWYSPPKGEEQTPLRLSHVVTGGADAKAEMPGPELQKCKAPLVLGSIRETP